MNGTLTILSVLAGFGAVAYVVTWLTSSLPINRYYRKVARYLQVGRVESAGVFSDGKVKGQYKGRQVEWRHLDGGDSGPFIEVVMQAKLQEEGFPAAIGLSVHLSDNISLEKDRLTYSSSEVFDATKVPEILEELYLAPKKYMKKLVFECFECGQKIGTDSDRCPKCGWTWNV